MRLHAQAQQHWILRLDVGDVPVRAFLDGFDRFLRGADQLDDLRIRDVRVVFEDEGNRFRLVLTASNRRVARTFFLGLRHFHVGERVVAHHQPTFCSSNTPLD